MIINSNNFAGIYFSTEGSILLAKQLFIIVIAVYLVFMGCMSYRGRWRAGEQCLIELNELINSYLNKTLNVLRGSGAGQVLSRSSKFRFTAQAGSLRTYSTSIHKGEGGSSSESGPDINENDIENENDNDILSNNEMDSEFDKVSMLSNSSIFVESNIEKYKNIAKMVSGGYKSYLNNIISLGLLEECENIEYLMKRVNDFLLSLEEGKTYSMLLVIRYYDFDSGDNKGITTSSSIQISKGISAELLCDRILIEISSSKLKYSFGDEGSELILVCREWLSSYDFKYSMELVNSKLNEVLKDSLRLGSEEDFINKRINEGIFRKYSSLNTINYNNQLECISKIGNKEIYKFNDSTALEVTREYDLNGVLIQHVNVLSIINGDVVFTDKAILSWVDTQLESEKEFKRSVGHLTYYYNKGEMLQAPKARS